MKLVDGSYQAVTQVKVLSPETTNIGRVDSVHLLEDRILLSEKGERNNAPRGLSPWHDNKGNC